MSDDGYVVDLEALEQDAVTFDGWSIVLDGVQGAIPLNLSPLDFSVIPGAQEVYQAFQAAAGIIADYVGEGSDQFDGFARTLLNSVKIYLVAESASAEDIARVTRELEEL